MDFEKIIG